MSFFIKRLAIVGVGLIGGSLARGLREQGLVGNVVGANRNPASLDKALRLGVIDHGTTNLSEAVHDANVVLVATPVRAIGPVVATLAPHLRSGAVVTDVGSVKRSVVTRCEAVMPGGVHFVGGHPIAGREHVGVEASFAALFEGSRTILTPTERTAPDALERVRVMWEAVGSRVEIMDAGYHDRVLAATSHLPHLMAYNVVNTLSDMEEHIRAEVFRYAAGGFRDFTRIASSDPVMWRDICIENRAAILEILARFQTDLEVLMRWIDAGDGDALHALFSRSKATRDRILSEHAFLRG